MLLELKDYSPISKIHVKAEWDRIMDIPNNTWDDKNISEQIDVINNDSFPVILRTFELNTLPVVIIKILDSFKVKEIEEEETFI